MDLPASTFAFANEVLQAQFALMDVNRRAQGDALERCGLGPNECDYRVILTGPHWRLREYATANVDSRSSVLFVPAPIKRPYVWDVASSVSAVRHCLHRRFRVYLLEWAPPSDEAQSTGIGEYANDAISECVARVAHEMQGKAPFLFGHSLGGTLAAIFCAIEQSVRGLVLLGAPLCFGPESSPFRDGILSMFPQIPSGAKAVPGSLLSQVSALVSPDTFLWARLKASAFNLFYPQALEINARIERWLLDEVPLPGRLVTEIVEFLYREDRFCRGALPIGDRTVGPSTVQVPILAIVNSADAIAPLGSVKPFLDAAPADEIRIIEFPGERGVSIQHLAFLAGPWVYAHIWPEIFSWLDARD